MKTPVPDYLQHVLTVCHDNVQGALADYIPELAAVDPNKFALALTTVDGTIYSTGDDETEFTMQSMSKPFAYALALQHLGIGAVLEKDRKSTRLNSSHVKISYAVFCLKKKNYIIRSRL